MGTDYTQDANCLMALEMKTDESPLSDSSGEGNTGALESAGNPAFTGSSPAGYDAGAYDFSSDLVTVTNFTNPNNGAHTWSSWVFAQSLGGTEKVIFHQLDGGGTGRTILSFDINSRLNSFVGGSATTSALQYATNTWYHMGVSWDSGGSGTLKLFVNGLVVSSSTKNPESAAGNHLIGEHKNGSSNFDGLITEASCFTRELTDAELLELYVHGLDGTQNVTEATPALGIATVTVVSPTITISNSAVALPSVAISTVQTNSVTALVTNSAIASPSLQQVTVDALTATASTSGPGATVASPSLSSVSFIVNSPTPLVSNSAIATPSVSSVSTLANDVTPLISNSAIASPSLSLSTVIVNTPSLGSSHSAIATASLSSVSVILNTPSLLITNSAIASPNLHTVSFLVNTVTASTATGGIDVALNLESRYEPQKTFKSGMDKKIADDSGIEKRLNFASTLD